jgi:hypothetical protein
MLDEAPLIGFLPNRQPGTGRAPGFNYLPIWPWLWTDPFKKIENQSINRI